MNEQIRGDLPLTVPVRDIVIGALRKVSRDRDEAYLLARLERGEKLRDIEDELEHQGIEEDR